MANKLLESLVCPACKQAMAHDTKANELVCEQCRLAFSIADGIPVMLLDEARKLDEE